MKKCAKLNKDLMLPYDSKFYIIPSTIIFKDKIYIEPLLNLYKHVIEK